MHRATLLAIQDLDVRYGHLHVLRDVSLKVPEGSIVSVVGANAAGKSTLLNTLAGLVPLSNGSITFRGEEIRGFKPHEIVSRGMALVPQGRRIFGSLTVRENLLMGFYPLRGRSSPEQLFNRVYELFPILRERSGQTAAALSGGEQQMLAVGRALMADPVLLLCDEISLGLSPLMVSTLYKGLRTMNESGMTILIVEQEVKRSLELANIICVIAEGRAVLTAPSGEITEELVRKIYFGVDSARHIGVQCP